jgi:hypothetical protein
MHIGAMSAAAYRTGEAMRERLHPRSALRLTAMLTLTIVLQGCGLLSSATQVPNRPIEVVGVVASEKTSVVGSRVFVDYAFDDGRTFSTDAGGRSPQVGDLLIAGSKPTPWVIGASAETGSGWPVGCYSLDVQGIQHETTVELDIGVTVPKAPDFKVQPVPVLGEFWRGALCLDREGRALEIFVSGA